MDKQNSQFSRKKVSFIVLGNPVTKKNSQRIVPVTSKKTGKVRSIPLPSAAYEQYRNDFIWQIPHPIKNRRFNVTLNLKCVYYMQTRRKVDLCNLQEATCDILVDAGVLDDDNCDIVFSMDGSRVFYDKENPRVEIEIEALDGNELFD